jgi:hypothetical protein
MLLKLTLALLATVSLADYSQDMAYYSMYYAAAAYCNPNHIMTWTCGDPCQRHANFVLREVFTITVMGAETSAFVGYDKDTGYAIVSFEGTHDPTELIDELAHFK